MMTERDELKERSFFRKNVWPYLLGGTVGLLFSYLHSKAYISFVFLKGMGASEYIAFSVGLFYLVGGLFAVLGCLFPKFGAHVLSLEDENEVREMLPMYLTSGAAIALWGAGMTILVLSAPVGPVPVNIAMVASIASILAGSALGYLAYRYSDEMMFAANMDASAISYFLAFGVLGGWAILGHSAVVDAPSSLDVLSTFYIVPLIGGGVIAAKRGLF